MILFVMLLCEPCAQMTNQFNLFGDELGRADWYLLPIEMQRTYLIFLSDTQSPMKISSYANITCERETSKSVFASKSTYSSSRSSTSYFIFRLWTPHFHALRHFADSGHKEFRSKLIGIWHHVDMISLSSCVKRCIAVCISTEN